MRIIVEKLFGSNEILEKPQNVEWQHGIDQDLEILIFNLLDARINESSANLDEIGNKVLKSRGNWVLQEMNCANEFIQRSTIDAEFDESILVCHIATQLCYYDDMRKTSLINNYSKISRCLSGYMLYLLVLCPNMLPKGFGYLKFKMVCGDLIRLSSKDMKIEAESSRDMKIEAACQVLLDEQLERYSSSQDPTDVGILMKGCALAKKLQNLEPIDNWGLEEKWEMMNKIGVEILTYAAGQCGWTEHAQQQLPKGGQLLTHVSLLMALFGINRQFQDMIAIIVRPVEDQRFSPFSISLPS